MTSDLRPDRPTLPFSALKPLAAMTAALMLTACAQTSDLLQPGPLAEAQQPSTVQTASTGKGKGESELQKATQYWGEQYLKNPGEVAPALNYARNLKAMGEREKAMQVLQQTSILHASVTEVTSEYGRLALEMDNVPLAAKLLEASDNPQKPDWRVISARGTVLAKQGQYKEAIPFYERALALAPNQASVMSNLAMAHAMRGDPKKAEDILRQAIAANGNSPKIRQNLALVLSLQGRYDESKQVAAADLADDQAKSNNDLVRKIVRLDPKATPAAPGAVPAFQTQVAKAPETPAQPMATAQAAPQFKPASDAGTATSTWATNVAAAVAAAPAKPQPRPQAPQVQTQPVMASGVALKGASQ